MEKKIYENFVKLYNRWSNNQKRPEDGFEYDTFFGKMWLKGKGCEECIESILNISEYSEDASADIFNANYSLTQNERKKIYDDEDPYNFLISSKSEGICIGFQPYDDIENNADLNSVLGNLTEDDYKTICKSIAMYLRDNVTISRMKGRMHYKLLLYTGDANDDFGEEFDFDLFEDDFMDNFDTNIYYWSYQYETNIGCDISYANIKNYEKMKTYINGYTEE